MTDSDPLRLPAPGRVNALICADVEQGLARLERMVHEPGAGWRMATVPLSLLPRLEPLIDAALANLAEIALAVWPHWYGRGSDDPAASLDAIDELAPVAAPGRGVLSRSWFRAAAARCRSGRSPLVAKLPRGLQAEQLALAIAPEDLLLCLAVQRADSPAERLYGFARAAEWLAQQTRARVLALLPESLAQEAALDSILYDAQRIPAVTGRASPERHAEARHRLLPLVGEPHPFSPGEQALAEALRRDPELGPLFGFNRYVTSESGIRYLVDLLWEAGKLVVEVDSYRYHGGPAAFGADRERDYELMASGYRVLRLTHDEAVENTPRALAKIRRLVQLRREQINSGNPSS